MGTTRPASGIKEKVHTLLNKDLQTALITRLSVSLCLNARRGTRRPHQWSRLVVAFSDGVQWQRWVLESGACVYVLPKSNNLLKGSRRESYTWYLYLTTKTLHVVYLTSYTNTLQFIDYQYFNHCKMLQILPTHNLHNPHAATRHEHGRKISRHRGAGKSVAPTESSTSLCRKIHRIRQNRLRDSGV